MRLSILIVNYNTETYIAELLDDISNQTLNPEDYEILLINNVQNDKLQQLIQQNFQDSKLNIQIINSEHNVGFGRAMNLGAHHAKGKHLLIGNPDLRLLQQDYLERLVTHAEQQKNYGVITTQLLNDDGTDTSEYYAYEFQNNLGYENQIAWFCGAVMLMQKSIFDQLKGFDDDFFMYCEDEDLCLRVKQAGLALIKMNDLKIYHQGGSSEPLKDVAFYQRWFRSQLLFAYKHYPTADFEQILSSLEKKSHKKISLYRWISFIRTSKIQNSYHKWQAIEDSIKKTRQDIDWLYVFKH